MPKIFTAKETAWAEPTIGAAGCSDRRDHGADDPINKHYQQGEAKQEEGSNNSSSSTKEAEEEDEHSEEWLDIFSQETEKTATWEVVEAEEEEAGSICFADLWDQIEALEERIKVQGMHIQQVKLEMDEGGVGDCDDLPNGQKFL